MKIIWLIPDAMSRFYLSCYDTIETYAETPLIDSIAREGAQFKSAISCSGFTPISFASFLTGLFPHRTGMNTILGLQLLDGNYWSRESDDFPSLNKDIPTIFDYLQKRNYVTKAFILRILGQTYDYSRMNLDMNHADNSIEKIKQFIEHAYDKDFLLMLRYDITHMPWIGDKNLFKNSEYSIGKDMYVIINKWLEADKDTIREDLNYIIPPTMKYLENVCIQPLIDLLKEKGIYDKTMLIIHSDHGDSWGLYNQNGDIGHHELYEPIIKVPLIIRYPPFFNPKTIVNRTVRLIDIFTMLLNLCQIEIGTDVDGIDLLKLIDNEDIPVYTVLNNLYTVGYRDDQFKYIYNISSKQERLIKIENDQEMCDCGKADKTTLVEYKFKLKNILGGKCIELTEQERAMGRLKELGYM